MGAQRSWKYLRICKRWSLISKKTSLWTKKQFRSFSFLLSFDSWIDTNRKSISQMGGSCSALPRSIDEALTVGYTCGAGQTISLEAERNRLIKMLIARLVRRPPAMTARSSAGVASRGVCEYLPLNLRLFSRFPFLSFFIHFARLFIARWIVYATTRRIWIMLPPSLQ